MTRLTRVFGSSSVSVRASVSCGSLAVQDGARDRQIDRIERQARGRLRDVDVDELGATERQLVEVGDEIDRVANRRHRFRQRARRRGERKHRLAGRPAHRYGRRDSGGERNGRAARPQPDITAL